MSENEGSSDEAIGRPQQWREGRYQEPAKSVTNSVKKPADCAEPGHADPSTPVTREDYEGR